MTPIRHRAADLVRRLPPRLRERLKAWLGAGGHQRSFVDQIRAERLALGGKRADHMLGHAQGILQRTQLESFVDRRVMDYGCGYLLADALIYSFLGAREVHAVDYQPLLQHRVMRDYARLTDWSALAVSAQTLVKPADAKIWIDTLNSALATGSARWWEALGIRYIAPYDCRVDPPPAAAYDAIVSTSTLEHVPPGAAAAIIAGLSTLVAPGGAVDHGIHLEDHRDFEHAPFAFLGADDDYTATDFDLRGNRLRNRDWRQIFDAQRDFDWTASISSRDLQLLPTRLATPFLGADPGDLVIGSLSITGRRRA